MCDDQFDTSLKMRKLFEEKQKQRMASKQYYQNLLYNPHRPPGGVPFDPALHRYCALSAYHVDNFVPKAKHYLSFIMIYIVPPTILTFMHLKKKSVQEGLIRSGQVKYEDRKTFVQ